MALLDVGATLGLPIWATVMILIWSLIWKGFALWKSARLRQPIWFIVLLIINTLGILEILYIYIFSRLKADHLTARKHKK